jgi:hypothetical protein
LFFSYHFKFYIDLGNNHYLHNLIQYLYFLKILYLGKFEFLQRLISFLHPYYTVKLKFYVYLEQMYIFLDHSQYLFKNILFFLAVFPHLPYEVFQKIMLVLKDHFSLEIHSYCNLSNWQVLKLEQFYRKN